MHVSVRAPLRVRVGFVLRPFLERCGYASEAGLDADRLAADLGCKPSLVRAWMAGHVVPKPYWIARLRQVLVLTDAEVVYLVVACALLEHARNVARDRDRPHPLEPLPLQVVEAVVVDRLDGSRESAESEPVATAGEGDEREGR